MPDLDDKIILEDGGKMFYRKALSRNLYLMDKIFNTLQSDTLTHDETDKSYKLTDNKDIAKVQNKTLRRLALLHYTDRYWTGAHKYFTS